MLGPFKTKFQREKYLVEFVINAVRSCEEQTLPDRTRWKVNENLFAGKQDWGQDGDGEIWQSRVFLHEYSPIIREAATALQNMIFEREDFVNLIATNEKDKEFARIREKMIRYYIEDMGFARKFVEYCMVGGIYGFATWKHTVRQKPVWLPEVVIEEINKQESKELSRAEVKSDAKNTYMPNGIDEIDASIEEAINKILGQPGNVRRDLKAKKRLELCMELKIVNPHLLFWDPSVTDINDSAYIVEKSFPRFIELLPLFEAGVLDPKKREKMMKEWAGDQTGVYSSRENLRQRQQDQFYNKQANFPESEILEYFGPVLGPDGEMLVESAHIIIGNGKHLLKDGVNGYWNQKPPFITSRFSLRPFKATGAGIADNAVSQQLIINEIFSLLVDAVKFDVYAPMGVNVDRLVDPSQVESGIRPHDVIQVMGDSKASDAFSELPLRSNVAPTLLQTVEALKLSGQKGSSVNTMTSNPASRARITSAEIQSNNSQRLQSMNSLGMAIDYECIEPIVKKTDSLILQFGLEDENLNLLATRGVLTESEYELLASMPAIDRFVEVSKHYKIAIRGFRALMDRDKQLARTSEFLSQLMVMPPQVQQSVQWSNVIKEVAELYGLDGDKWLFQNTPQDKAREENHLLQDNQVVGIAQEDDDFAHLPVHYEHMLMVGPVQAIIAHVNGHIERILKQGGMIPPPPPEVAEMLGMPPPMSPNQAKQTNSLSKTEKEIGAPARGPEDLLQ